MLERLRDYQLYINLKKCQFDIKEIQFLRFIVSIDEVQINLKRIRTIAKWSRFKIYKEVQVFLEFINFYRRFIYCYFAIVASLTNLLKGSKKDKTSRSLKWIDNAKRTFQKLRDIFIFISLLICYDSAVKIRVKTNVSNFAVARILNQQNNDDHWRSMTFWSRKMISIEQNYKTHD